MPFADIPDIANCDLTLSDVPAPDSELGTIFHFALTFDGYEYWGTEKCGRIANKRRHKTLTELRTCLFFEQRRYHHIGEGPNVEDEQYIRSLITKVKAMVVAGRTD